MTERRTGLTGTARMEAFTDGVLAVAITLLVLDLRVPHVGEASLWRALVDQWPTYAAYVTSFLSIGIMWINHHSLLRSVASVDRRLMFTNLVLLLVIVVVPFSTSVVADYVKEPGINAKVAMATYSGVSVVIGTAFAALWGYVIAHPELLDPAVDLHAARRSFPRFAAGTIVYLALVGMSFLQPLVALLLHLSVAVYYAFERLPAGAPLSAAAEG